MLGATRSTAKKKTKQRYFPRKIIIRNIELDNRASTSLALMAGIFSLNISLEEKIRLIGGIPQSSSYIAEMKKRTIKILKKNELEKIKNNRQVRGGILSTPLIKFFDMFFERKVDNNENRDKKKSNNLMWQSVFYKDSQSPTRKPYRRTEDDKKTIIKLSNFKRNVFNPISQKKGANNIFTSLAKIGTSKNPNDIKIGRQNGYFVQKLAQERISTQDNQERLSFGI